MEKDEKGGGKSNNRAQKAKAKLSKESVPERYNRNVNSEAVSSLNSKLVSGVFNPDVASSATLPTLSVAR